MSTTLIKIAAAAAAVLVLLAALFYAEQYIEGLGYSRAKAEDTAAIEKVKREATATLAAESERVREHSRAMNAMLANQNLKDSNHEKTVADLSDRLRRAAGPAGRLRDPHAPGCGTGSSSATGGTVAGTDQGATDRTEAGGLLSVPLTDLLNRIVREADDINVAYASCRADAYTVRGAP